MCDNRILDKLRHPKGKQAAQVSNRMSRTGSPYQNRQPLSEPAASFAIRTYRLCTLMLTLRGCPHTQVMRICCLCAHVGCLYEGWENARGC